MQHETRVAITVAPVVACGLRLGVVSASAVEELLQIMQDLWIARDDFLERVADRACARRTPSDQGPDPVFEGLPDVRILSRRVS
jgi:hypothetical protein